MSIDDLIDEYGLVPQRVHLGKIRGLLELEIKKERKGQGAGDTELMKLLCVQLFSAGMLDDISLIWDAKMSSMDASAAIEIQLLCGAGLESTKKYLDSHESKWATDVLQYLIQCEKAGDFIDYSHENQLACYREYFDH